MGDCPARVAGGGDGGSGSSSNNNNSKFFSPPPFDFYFIPKDMPLPSFVEATMPMMGEEHGHAIFAAIQQANKLKQEGRSPLDLDKTAAICLYMMQENEISCKLNKTLRNASKNVLANSTEMLQPWIKYVRLLSEALNQLPNIPEDVTLYRHMKQDLEPTYKPIQGQVVCWPGFTTCSLLSVNISDPNEGKRTLFQIQCRRAKNVKEFCPADKSEEEVLIMATTKFKVLKVDGDGDITVVNLEEADVDEGYSWLNIASSQGNSAEILCERHNKKKIKYLCHDCGDKLVCTDCVQTLPCSEHKRRRLLMEGISSYQRETEENMNHVDAATWKEHLEQGIKDMNVRIELVETVKVQRIAKVEQVFDGYMKRLLAAKENHLAVVQTAASKRSELLKERRIEIEKNLGEIQTKIDSVTRAMEASKDGTQTKVERMNMARSAKDASVGVMNVVAKSMIELSEWRCDLEADNLHFWTNYNTTGVQLDATIQRLELRSLNPEEQRLRVPVDLKSMILPTKRLMKMDFIAEGICQVSPDVVAVAESNGDIGRISLVSLSKMAVIRSFGETILKGPYGICIGNQGHFIVTDKAKNQVFMFHCDDGKMLASTSPIKIPMNSPMGVCYDRKGSRIVIADAHNHRVLLYTPLDARVQILGSPGSKPGQFHYPVGVDMDSKGRMAVTDWGNNRIQIFEERVEAPSPTTSSSSATVVASSTTVVAANNASTPLLPSSPPPSSAPVKAFKFVSQFGTMGSGPGEFLAPLFLMVDANDRMVISDSKNERVQVMDFEGKFLGATRKIGQMCRGVCLDGSGRIVVVSANPDKSIYVVG